MGDVSVIGTGAMGSALAEALAASGAEVRVWNRTREKAEEILGPRVRSTGSVADALTSSPFIASRTSVEASVDTWGDGAAEYADHLRDMGLDAGMYDALHRLFTATSEAGHGDADWTRVAEHEATR